MVELGACRRTAHVFMQTTYRLDASCDPARFGLVRSKHLFSLYDDFDQMSRDLMHALADVNR